MRYSPSILLFALFLLCAPSFSQTGFNLDGQIDGQLVNQRLGAALDAIPDINNDGEPDFWAQSQGPVVGNGYLLFSHIYQSDTLTEKHLLLRSGDNIGTWGEQRKTAHVGDVNFDGIPDYVVLLNSYTICCISGSDGVTCLWQWYDPYMSFGSILRTDDANFDSVPDILVESFPNRYLLSGSSGGFIWGYDYDAANEHYPVELVGDVNGDGTRDISVLWSTQTSANFYFSIRDGATNSILSTGQVSASQWTKAPPQDAGDVNADGISDAVWVADSTLYFLDGSTDLTTTITSIAAPSGAYAKGGVDFDKDGVPDTVVYNADPVLLISGSDQSTIDFIDNPTNDPMWAMNVGLLNGTTKASIVIPAASATANNLLNAGIVLLYGYTASSGGPIGGGDQESPGGEWDTTGSMEGGSAEDRLGYAINGLHADLNGDGCNDVLISAIGADTNGLVDNGQVHVVSGADITTIIYSLDGSQNSANYGSSVDVIGDLDGDSFPDFIVGSSGYKDSQGLNIGAAFVYSGQTGSLLVVQFTPGALGTFGNSVAGIGDVNGDGTPDYAVGDMLSLASSFAGSVSVFDGSTHLPMAVLTGGNTGDFFGVSIAGLGDVNTDGFDDFAVGAIGADLFDQTGNLLLSNCGLVEVYAGGSNGPSLLWSEYGENDDDFSGYSLAHSGDMDGDGEPDFVVGEPGFDVVTTARGVTLSGAGRTRKRNGKTGASLGNANGGSSGGGSGTTTGGGDHNGDGNPDVSSGSPGSTSSIGTGGRAPLTEAGMVTIWNGVDDSIMWRRVGTNQGERIGQSLANVGDINCDGRDDLLLGSPTTPNGNGDVNAGAVHSATFNPYASSTGTGISVSQGGSVVFDIDFPSTYGSFICHTLMSTTGVGPTDIADLAVPLTSDNVFWASVFGSYPKGNWINRLDAFGDSSFTLSTNPNGPTPWLGRTVYFSFVAHTWRDLPQVATGVLSVTFTP